MKNIIILVLIGYLVFWYFNPEQGKEYIDTGVEAIKGIKDVNDNIPAFCDDDGPKVCGTNNITYPNACHADQAGVEFYAGECP